MTFRPLLFVFAGGLLTLAAVAACDGIVDPTKTPEEPIATVSGALTGSALPAGARVALVWRVNGSALSVGTEAPIVDGKFQMRIGRPPAGAFATLADAPPVATVDASIDTRTLRPLETVKGSVVEPLETARAGFVVYTDDNGNERLDLGSDRVVAGNDELVLTYFRGGGVLDFEKLRDRSGILPRAGYNLGWLDPAQSWQYDPTRANAGERWLPLDAVELQISDDVRLPYRVCEGTPPSTICSGGFGPDSGIGIDSGVVIIDASIDTNPGYDEDAAIDAGPPAFDSGRD